MALIRATDLSRPEFLILKHGRFNGDNERSFYFDVKGQNRAPKLKQNTAKSKEKPGRGAARSASPLLRVIYPSFWLYFALILG